ncbi:MAG: PAS domain-containing protein, partial [Methanobacteriota archaeon]
SILTLMLHFSGGIENPLSFAYLFHVILSGILLEKQKSYAVVVISALLFTTMGVLELSGVVPHYTLRIFPHSQAEEHVHEHASAGHSMEPGEGGETHIPENGVELVHASHFPVYVWSMSLLNFFIMLLTAFFITTIMEQLRAEERKTLEERQRLEHVLKATGAGLLILDKELTPVWFNEPVKEWLTPTPEDSGNSLEEILENWIENQKEIIQTTLQAGTIHTIERERYDQSGQKRFFQITVAPLKDPEENPYQVVELIQDVTEKKILEAEMIHASKMVTLGTMAAGIAHEVGNPLASISTRLHLLESERDETFITKSIQLLQKEIHRIERIVRGISQFGRPSPEGWQPCNVNEILLETVEMLKYHKLAKQNEIDVKLSNELTYTLGVRDQLKQVFLNLGLNALEAMPEGGTLTIVSKISRGDVVVQFIDTGVGIPEDVREKIFQPFFTTREKGSGLGLFIVNHIIQAHGGTIEVDSKINKGSIFTVRLVLHRISKRL